MMPAMNVPGMTMPQGNMMSPGPMMPQMMMPMPMPMMGMGMMPQMMMPQMMMGVMPVMAGAGGTPLLCRMTVEMGKDSLVCKITPMEGAGLDLLRERAEAMTRALSVGVPVTMMSGPHVLVCAPTR